MREDWLYGDFQEEMDMFNRAFTAVMLQGDGKGGQAVWGINVDEKGSLG